MHIYHVNISCIRKIHVVIIRAHSYHTEAAEHVFVVEGEPVAWVPAAITVSIDLWAETA